MPELVICPTIHHTARRWTHDRYFSYEKLAAWQRLLGCRFSHVSECISPKRKLHNTTHRFLHQGRTRDVGYRILRKQVCMYCVRVGE